MINETKTPNDLETIIKSFKRYDMNDEKMTPTQKFLEITYEMLKDELFERETMPDQLLFKVSSRPRSSFLGTSSAHINRMTDTVTPTQIYLNSAKQLSLHDWIGVVLHEMVHIYDYRNNPEHFLGYMRGTYDSHGTWFLDFGEQFKKYGFEIQRYYEKEIGINTDDNKVKNIMNNSIFLVFDGMMTVNGKTPIVRINKKYCDDILEYIQMGVQRGRYNGLKRIIEMTSSNPNIVNLRQFRMKDSYSTLRYYYFDDKFKEKYGPFKELNSTKIVKEDKDETEYDEMNRIDDEHARKMYDNIKGVVNVKKEDDDIYEIEIF